MNLDLSRKTIVVIGGARGIGAEVVRSCAASGAAVAWSRLDTPSDAAANRELERELHDANREFFSAVADCTDEAASRDFFSAIGAKRGRIDGMVYCAGFTSPLDFCDISYTEWRRVVDINLNGAFLSIHCALPLLRAAGGGSIVLIGSAAVASGGGGRADYVSAKAGLEGLSRAVTKGFAPEKIRCNIIHPSLIDTDLLKQRHPDPAKREALAREVPLRRLGTPSDIAAAAVFLLSEASGYITAQSLYVDGGRSFCK